MIFKDGHSYGELIYNHKLNYDNNFNIDNGNLGNSNDFRNNDEYQYYNYHNTIFIFSILSCEIWYCAPFMYTEGTRAATINFSIRYGYGWILYNHHLNYNNNSDTYNGIIWASCNSYWENTTEGTVRHENYHNTTLLSGNLYQLYQTISSCTI